jgi:spore germination protein YaaH
MLYIAAFAIAAVLLYETFLLARQRPELPAMVWEAPEPATPTARAAISQADATLFEDIPTSVPADVAASTDQVTTAIDQGQHPKTGRYIAAWFPESFSGGARESFEANKDVIDELSPFWYTTDSSGRLYGHRDDELVRVAHESNVLVIPAIHNIGTYDVVINVISDPQIRARHIQNIVDEVVARNYDGIDIDYESLPESTRPAFSAFIIELAEALHAHGKLLTVAVHAKDCDYCGLGGFQDWSVIGLHADRVRIMTYDYHWRGGGAGPVAPLYWVESVAEYARTIIPPEKIFIGVPFYGYDWPSNGGSAIGLPWADIEDLIDSQSLTVNLMQRDSRGRVDESWFRYETPQGTREVWFMTDDGLESKLELVQQMDLAGIAIWRIGYEKPEYWDVIRNTLVQDPMLVQRAINPLLPEH